MKNTRHDLVLRLFKILYAVLIAVPFAWAWYARYVETMEIPYYNKGNWAIVGLFLVFFAVFGRVYNAFLVSLTPLLEMVYSQALACAVSDFFMYFIMFLLIKELPNPLPLMAVFVVQLLLSVLWSAVVRFWYFKSFAPKKTAIIYDMRHGLEDMVHEYGLEKKFNIVATVPIADCLKNLDSIREMETVFISGVHSHERNILLKYCLYNNIEAYIIPRVGDVILRGAKTIQMFHLPVWRAGRYNPNPFYSLVKRVADIVVSGAGIVVLSPVFLVTAVAVKLTDGGPILYKQARLTKDGKIFSIYKFRSMRVDAEKDGVARLSTGENDDRITPVGKFIRKIRVDELPQLFNILFGHLTLVGPRPERPEIAEKYCEKMPEFSLRLQVKAGLTGYAQVYGKYNTTPYDKLQMDLMYISNPSILEDLRICFATIKILFMPESTDGIAEGQTTAMVLGNEEEMKGQGQR